MNKWMMTVIAIVVSVLVGGLLPYAMSDQAVGVGVDEQALQDRFKEELLLAYEKSLQETYNEEWDSFVKENPKVIEGYLDTINGRNLANEKTEEVQDEPSQASDILASDSTDAETESDSDVAVEITESDEDAKALQVATEVKVEETPVEDEIGIYELDSVPLGSTDAPVTESVVKDAWVNQKISDNREEISDADLYTGAEVYNKLDTNYLFGLAGDGLTSDEEAEVKAYLTDNLSDGELAIAVELYNKYVHLLD